MAAGPHGDPGTAGAATGDDGDARTLELPCAVCGAAVKLSGGALETPNPETFCELFKGDCACGAFVTYSAQGRRARG